MKKIVKDICVDSGLILISDKTFYNKYNGVVDEELCKKIKIKNGTYKVNWYISNTWNGRVEGKGILKVNSEEIIVSDPCYHFQKGSNLEWARVLNDTNYFTKEPDGCVVLNKMGGDGCFNVHFNLELTAGE